MTRSNRYHGGSSRLPKLLFTCDDILLFKNALTTLESLLRSKPQSLPKIRFAVETVSQLQIKIAQIAQRQAWGYEISLDANEIIILHTAAWLFLAALEALPDSPEKQTSLGHCLALQSQLAPIVATAMKK